MWWKVYFWIMAITGVIGAIGFLGDLLSGDLTVFITLPILAIGIIGLFAFVYKKQIFNRSVWKVFFIIQMINLIVGIIQIALSINSFSQAAEANIFAVIGVFAFMFIFFMLPEYYAIYQLGYTKKVLKK